MEPDKQTPGEILNRIFSGTASETEKDMIRQWMLSMDVSDPATASEEELQTAKITMLARIMDASSTPAQPSRRNALLKVLTMWKAAAAVVLLAIASWFFINRGARNRQQKDPIYTAIAATERDAKHIKLPDGSEVWLNARSKLEYVQDLFNKENRCVRLTGEGYFEITKDDARPFIVASENIETRVLGTAFNIETYPGEAEIRVALVHGAVAVKDIHTNNYTLLHPNEMLRYSKGNKKWGVVPFSANMVRNWLNGHLIFEELPLLDVLDRFAYKYGITLQYDKELVKHKRVTGDFSPDKWQTVLDNILFIHKLTYTTKNGIVYINKR